MAELTNLLEANREFAATFDKGHLEIPPSRHVAVLTCIDALRSLLIPSWLLGTREFVVLHHADCGMTMFTDDVLRDKIRGETGRDASDWEFLSFPDVDQSVRDDVQRIRGLRLLPDDVTVGGYVYDMRTGGLREVVPANG